MKGCHDLCALWGKDHSRAGWREVIMATERKHCRRLREGWSMTGRKVSPDSSRRGDRKTPMGLALRMSREYRSPRKRQGVCHKWRPGPDFKKFLKCSGNAPSVRKWCLILRLRLHPGVVWAWTLGSFISRRLWMRSPGEDVEVRGNRLGVRARFRPQLPKLTPNQF